LFQVSNQQAVKEPESYSTIMIKCGRRDLVDLLESIHILSHSTEIKSVVKSLRDVNVYYLSSSNYDEQLEELSNNGLLFSPLIRIKNFCGFSNVLQISDEIGPGTSVYGIISKDSSSIKKFKRYFDSGDDYNMGLMLGYPECCCRGYVDYSKRTPDPIYEIAKNTPHDVYLNNNLIIKDIPWMIQSHMRYFELRIIPFFPCNYFCDEAQKTAKEWYDLMYSIDSCTTEKLKSLMLEPSTWSLYNAQVLVNKPPSKANFIGYAISYYFPQKMEVDFYPM